MIESLNPSAPGIAQGKAAKQCSAPPEVPGSRKRAAVGVTTKRRPSLHPSQQQSAWDRQLLPRRFRTDGVSP